MKKDPRVYLAQILERIGRIEEYTACGKEVFLRDRMAQDAVIRNFEIIGEATKRVPQGYTEAHSDVPWRGLAAFRDVLIHQYEGVDMLEVWRVVEFELSPLKDAIAKILPALDQLEKEVAEEDDENNR